MYLPFMSIYKIWCDMLGVMYNFLDNAHILHNRVLQVVHVILLLAANPVIISSKDIIKDSLIVITHAVFCIVYLLVGLSLNLIKFAEIHAPELFDGIKEDLEEHRRQDKHVGAQGFKIHIQVSRIFSCLFDFKMYLTSHQN